MEIEYSLNEKDYLEYLLYEGSKNKYNKKTRRKNWIIISSIPFLIYLIQYDLKEDFKLTDFEKTNVYRIVQEVVSNIIKHAGANKIDVILNDHNQVFNLTVKDNGVGFDKINSFKNDGIGLPNMFSRVKSMNGELVVEAKKGDGATLNIFFPYQNKI